MRRLGALAAITTLTIVGIPFTVVADPALRRTTTAVNWHPQSGTGAVEGASATLVTTSAGASVRIRTSRLNPGHAYTLWWVVINNPAECVDFPAPCRPNPDVLVNSARTQSQILFAAGHAVGEAGGSTFAAHLPSGPIDNGWLGDQGFTNPRGAEIHVVLNDHGPALAAHMPDMIRTNRGGCSDASPFPSLFPATALADGEPGPNICLLYQSAVFQQQ